MTNTNAHLSVCVWFNCLVGSPKGRKNEPFEIKKTEEHMLCSSDKPFLPHCYTINVALAFSSASSWRQRSSRGCKDDHDCFCLDGCDNDVDVDEMRRFSSFHQDAWQSFPQSPTLRHPPWRSLFPCCTEGALDGRGRHRPFRHQKSRKG